MSVITVNKQNHRLEAWQLLPPLHSISHCVLLDWIQQERCRTALKRQDRSQSFCRSDKQFYSSRTILAALFQPQVNLPSLETRSYQGLLSAVLLFGLLLALGNKHRGKGGSSNILFDTRNNKEQLEEWFQF